MNNYDNMDKCSTRLFSNLLSVLLPYWRQVWPCLISWAILGSLFLSHPSFAFAEIHLTGAIDVDTTWSRDGNPYILGASLSVEPGATLTIEPGVHVKIGPSGNLSVYGSVLGGLVGGDSIIFTSLKDDSVDGDTNNDATSTLPAAGDWELPITFNAGSVGNFKNTIFRYGGYQYCYGGCREVPMIINDGGSLVFSDSTLSDSRFAAILQTSGSLDVSDSTFQRDFYTFIMKGGTASIRSSNIETGIGISNYSSFPVSAVGNWWGDSSGPRYGDDNNAAGASGGWIFGPQISYFPWLIERLSVGAGISVATSSATSTPSCLERCFSNVLFLPGFEGSRLYMADNLGGENRLWEPNRDNDATLLGLNDDGFSKNNVYTKDRDIISEAYFSGGPNVYKAFIENMDALKSSGDINDWRAMSYDWRLSLDGVLGNDQISDELVNLAESSKTSKVTIVAHSNGGLVAKALMIKLAEIGLTSRVDKIIFVAVPQFGTPQAIGSLLHGFKAGIPFFLSAKAARRLGENMLGAYNLLPSNSYFGSTTEPVIYSDGTLIDSWSSLSGFLAGGDGRDKPDYADVFSPTLLRQNLLDIVEGSHAIIDSWVPPSGVDLVEIAGTGLYTVSGIRYFDGLYEPILVLDGDGTVLTRSALALSDAGHNVRAYWVDLGKYNSHKEKVKGGRLFSRGHADILEVEDVEDIIRKEIKTGEERSYEYLSFFKLIPKIEDDRLTFFLHSLSDSLDIFDEDGRHTGFSTTTEFIEEQIPDSEYREFGSLSYVSVKKPKSGKVPKIKAVISKKVSSESLVSKPATLHVKEFIKETLATTTIFTDIPASTTVAVSIEASLGTSSEPYILTNIASTTIPTTDTTSTTTTDNLPINDTVQKEMLPVTLVKSGGSRSLARRTPPTEPMISIDVSISDFIDSFQRYKLPIEEVKIVASNTPATAENNQTASVFNAVNSVYRALRELFKGLFLLFTARISGVL